MSETMRLNNLKPAEGHKKVQNELVVELEVVWVRLVVEDIKVKNLDLVDLLAQVSRVANALTKKDAKIRLYFSNR